MDKKLQARVDQLWEMPRIVALREAYAAVNAVVVQERKERYPDLDYVQQEQPEPLKIKDFEDNIKLLDAAGVLTEDNLLLQIYIEFGERVAKDEQISALLTPEEHAAVIELDDILMQENSSGTMDPYKFFERSNLRLACIGLATMVGGVLSVENLPDSMEDTANAKRVAEGLGECSEFMQRSGAYIQMPLAARKVVDAAKLVVSYMRPGFISSSLTASAGRLEAMLEPVPAPKSQEKNTLGF